MATGKRYYWIKLKDSFMTSDTVDYFMSQPDGANYVVLYQMLLLKTINTDGRLERRIGEVIIPYDIEKIQRDCKWFSTDTIRVALNLYRSFGLIYEDADGVLTMSGHNELVGSETDFALQKRNKRHIGQVLLQGVDNGVDNVHIGGVDNGVDNVHIDIRDKIIDIEKEKTLSKDSAKEKRFVRPSVEEVRAYCEERNNGVDAEAFCDFYESNGWKVGKNSMKDWKAAVRNWERKEQYKPKKEIDWSTI